MLFTFMKCIHEHMKFLVFFSTVYRACEFLADIAQNWN